MKTILLTTLFGTIHLELSAPDGEGKVTGEILSGFADAAEPFDAGVEEVDFIESLILAHACAGVDVEAPAYITGLETALEAIDNHS